VLKVHVLFETHGGKPHGCSYIRLLNPLLTDTVKGEIELSYGVEIPSGPIDVLVVERLWDQVCSFGRDGERIKRLRKSGTKIVFEIDDNLLDVDFVYGAPSWPSIEQKMWLRRFVRLADCVVVSTPNLARRLEKLNSNIKVIENYLDGQLFAEAAMKPNRYYQDAKIVFGYMGTYTHLMDLLSIIQPLRSVLERYRDTVRFEILGIGDGPGNLILKRVFGDLPVKFLSVDAKDVDYPRFTKYMQSNMQWDFGIAPLLDNIFTRCKSDIKFLDYGVLGIPGIFSDVAAYSSSVLHGENGLLATDSESWVSALELMITDSYARDRLAANAHRHIWRERMVDKMACKWLQCLREVGS